MNTFQQSLLLKHDIKILIYFLLKFHLIQHLKDQNSIWLTRTFLKKNAVPLNIKTDINNFSYSQGYRKRTRYMFSRDFRKRGTIPLSTYLATYKKGDIVDIKGNGAIQKGLPHKFYHGNTGIVFDVTRSSVGVIVYKILGNEYIEKRIHVKVEHVKHSDSRKDFLDRVKTNQKKKDQAKETGEKLQLKRLPAQPREAHIVSTKGNSPITITAVPYETYI